MIPLTLPSFSYCTKTKLNKTYILDLIYKKYLLLTPEEWVRQHVLNYLMHYLAYPKGLLHAEKKIHGIAGYYRADILLCDKFGRAKMLVECKAPHIALTNTKLGQIMLYNRHIPVDVLLLTNGITHFCWQLEKKTGQFKPLSYIPMHQEIKTNLPDYRT